MRNRSLIILAVLTTFCSLGIAQANDVYRVQKGDTLYGISRMFGVSVNQIVDQNMLRSSLIYPGQTLAIPSGYGANSGHSSNQSYTQNYSANTSTQSNAQQYQSQSGRPVVQVPSIVHTVQKGETLWSISRKYGTNVKMVSQLNQLQHDRILEGQRLFVPAGAPPQQQFTTKFAAQNHSGQTYLQPRQQNTNNQYGYQQPAYQQPQYQQQNANYELTNHTRVTRPTVPNQTTSNYRDLNSYNPGSY